MTIASSPVQTVVKNTWTSGSSFTITIAAPADGNAGLVMFTGTVASTAISSISQTGATWVRGVTNTTTREAEVWYCLNFSGAGTTVTVTLNNTPISDGALGCIFAEWNDSSGSTSGWTLDATGTNNGSTSNPLTASITPTSGRNALIVDSLRMSGESAGPAAGFTQFSVGQTANNIQAYQVVSSTSGSYQDSYTASAAAWGSAIITLLAPSGGGGGSTVNLSATAAGSASASAVPRILTTVAMGNVAGQATTAATLSVKRRLTLTSAGHGAATVTLTSSKFMARATGQATTSVALHAIRSQNIAVGGQSTVSLALHARRAFQPTAAGLSSVGASLNVRRALSVAPQGQADIFALLAVAAVASQREHGKYKPEHDSALSDIANATGFAAEHRSALRDFMDFGV